MGETEKSFQQLNQPPIVGLLGEFVGHQARHSHSQDEEGDFTVFLVNARRIEVRELGLRPQGIKRFADDLSVQAECSLGIAEGLDCLTLAAKLFVYPIEAVGAFKQIKDDNCFSATCLSDDCRMGVLGQKISILLRRTCHFQCSAVYP